MMDEIKELIHKYEGKICELDEEYISLTSSNDIGALRPIDCYLEVSYLPESDKYRMSCYEKSCTVLGGVGGTFSKYEIMNEVKLQLKRYNFRRK